MRGRDVPRAKAKVYLGKAEEFAEAARDSRDEERFDAAVSAAAHATINAADATCVWYLQVRSAGPSHDEAIDLIQRIDDIPADERDRLMRNLQALLDLKHKAEYADRTCTPAEAARAVKAMDRALGQVQAWAEGW